MSGLRAIISPRLIGSLDSTGHFPDTVTIQVVTETKNEYQEPVQSWANALGMVDLAANVAPTSTREVRTPNAVYAEATHTIMLAGAWETITTRQRAVDDRGRVFDILGVETDTFATTTRLMCRMVVL